MSAKKMGKKAFFAIFPITQAAKLSGVLFFIKYNVQSSSPKRPKLFSKKPGRFGYIRPFSTLKTSLLQIFASSAL